MPRPLLIPDVRQRSDFDCGQAAVEAVFRYHGLTGAVRRLANPVQGMAPDTLEAVLRSVGLAVLSGEMTAADLRHLTATGRPVLCPIQHDGVGHWVVAAGVARGKVHYHDPLAGPRSLRLAEWADRWTDTGRHGTAFVRFGVCGWPK